MIDETTAAELDDEAFDLFASAYPHEAYAEYPERFWAYFHGKCPNVSRDDMERLLKEEEES